MCSSLILWSEFNSSELLPATKIQNLKQICVTFTQQNVFPSGQVFCNPVQDDNHEKLMNKLDSWNDASFAWMMTGNTAEVGCWNLYRDAFLLSTYSKFHAAQSKIIPQIFVFPHLYITPAVILLQYEHIEDALKSCSTPAIHLCDSKEFWATSGQLSLKLWDCQ